MAIRIESIKITLEQIANGNILLLTDVSPIKEYVDGKPTDKILGFYYHTVCPQNKFEQVRIKVEESMPLITPEELAEKGTIKVAPLNFSASFYRDRNGVYQLSAKAERIEVVK